jgi:hypothetical protein
MLKVVLVVVEEKEDKIELKDSRKQARHTGSCLTFIALHLAGQERERDGLSRASHQ